MVTKRRARGEGTLNRRADGRWEGRLTLSDGRRRSFYGPTQEAVVTQLIAVRGRPNQSEPPARLTVASYLQQWLEGQKLTVSDATYRRYEQHVRLHLIPELGRYKLGALTRAHILAAYGRRRQAGLSATSIQLVHGVLHKALNDAVLDPAIGLGRNPAFRISTPRSTPEMQPLTEAEARRFLKAASDVRLEAMFVLACTCGMRIGEVLALRWRYVDLDARRLRIAATLRSRKGGVPVFGEPKTARSRREVQLSGLAIEALRRHRTAQLEERLAAGPRWTDYDLVFTTDQGAPIDANNFTERTLKPLLERAELPPIRFHDLRHTAATTLMGAGIPIKVASEMLGHADVATTLRVYSHVLPGMQEQAAAAMDRLFGEVVEVPRATESNEALAK